VRKTLQTVAFLGPALALIILSRSKDPRLAVACMTCALGITSLGKHAGIILCCHAVHSGKSVGGSSTWCLGVLGCCGKSIGDSNA